MKKVLLVLLFMVIASGLFAQVTWGARVYGGYNAILEDGASDWNLKWNSAAGAFAQARLYGTFKNEAGTVGGALQFRGTISNASVNVTVSQYYGWFTLFDKQVKILGGRWADGEFSEQYVWAGSLWLNNKAGLAINFYPMDGLRLGFGMHAPENLNVFDDMAYWFGAAYETGDIGLYAQMDFAQNNINAQFDFRYDSDPILAVLNTHFSRLDNFSDYGEIALNEYFGYSGIENVDLGLSLWENFYGDGSATVVGTEFDITYNTNINGLPAVGIELELGIAGDSYFRAFPFIYIGQSASRNYLQLGYGAYIDFNGDNPTFDNNIRLRFFWRI